MPRADRVYTNGLMTRLERTVPTSDPGRVWHLEQGSVTYGRWWRVFERDTTTGALHREIVAGRTEYDLQRALGAYLDGYDRARDILIDALSACTAFVELYTDNGVTVQPPAYLVSEDGTFDPERFARFARKALGR